MVPLAVVVLGILVDGGAQVPLAEQQHPAETLLRDRSYEAFRGPPAPALGNPLE